MFTKNWWWWGGGVMPAKFPGPPTNPVSGPTDLWDTSNGITLGQKTGTTSPPCPPSLCLPMQQQNLGVSVYFLIYQLRKILHINMHALL